MIDSMTAHIPITKSQFVSKKYNADSGRGSGSEQVFCAILTSPDDILRKKDNFVVNSLRESGVESSIGLYFYRFRNYVKPFIKIGECTRQDGVGVRFSRGWHGTERYSDTYLKSELATQINLISSENPAYFVFYEHSTQHSHPKIDEVFAYRMHKRLFKCGTASPERMNGNPLLARSLVWHKKAFSEVVLCQFPDGSAYPGANL